MTDIFNIKKKDSICILVIFLIAMVIRLTGIHWGFTHNFQPDEKKLVYSAVQMVQDGTFYHNSFIYPNQTIVHIAAVLLKIFSSVPVRRGDIFEFYVIYRALVAVIGSLVVPLAYVIGNYVKRNMGIVLSILVCLFPPFINYSKQVTGDTVVMIYCLLLVIVSILYYETKKNIFLPIMSYLAALATMEKWHGAAITLNIAFIIFVVALREKSIVIFIRGGIVSIISYVISIFIIAPHILTNINKLIEDLRWVYYYDDAPKTFDFSTLFSSFFSYFGIVTFIIFMISLIYVIVGFCKGKDSDQSIKLMIVTISGFINYISMGLLMNRMFERWGLEFYFALLIFISYFITVFFVDAAAGNSIRLICGIYSALLLLALITGAVRIDALALYSYNDTRVLGEEVYDDIGITMDNSVYEGYTVFSPGGIRDYSLGGSGQKEHQMDYYIYYGDDKSPHVRHETAQYAITSSIIKDGQTGDSLDSYDILDKEAKLIKVIDSDIPSLFESFFGLGAWNAPETKAIMGNIRVAIDLVNGASSGPEMKIFDISGFSHDMDGE